MKSKIMIPNAPILVESTRSVGYSFEAALADIIDNSIGKNARNVDIFFASIGSPYIAVVDDAIGMTEEELEVAMQYGSRSSLEAREKDDLGRFGLGLKMASLSQCRCLTVASKKNGVVSATRWDLDHILKEDNWSLIKFEENEINELKYIDKLSEYTSGTIVIWEKFDRLSEGTDNFQKTFDTNIEIARNHIALVFHRFMSDDNFSKKVKINFNNSTVIPVDPFLIDNPATQPLSEQSLIINNSEIKVKPFILPHISKLKEKDKTKLTDIIDLRTNQGFYVYRNKRLIIWGTWFRLMKNFELNKLARIRVDIPNSLDSIWQIDIKKSSASLPDMIKKNLIRIVEDAIGRSERVYQYRGRKVSSDDFIHIWNVINNRGSYKYEINKELPLIKEIENRLDEKSVGFFHSLLSIIEDTFPYSDVYYRIAKKGEIENSTLMESEEAFRVGYDMLSSAINLGSGVKELLDTMEKIEFFRKYPDVLQRLREENSNE